MKSNQECPKCKGQPCLGSLESDPDDISPTRPCQTWYDCCHCCELCSGSDSCKHDRWLSESCDACDEELFAELYKE